jgi:hypothetical protein
MAFKFESLRVWQMSLDLADELILLLSGFHHMNYTLCQAR